VSGGLNRPRSDPAGLGAREAGICAASGEPGDGGHKVQSELACDENDVIDGVDAADWNGDDRPDGGNMPTSPRCDDVSLAHALDDPDADEALELIVSIDDMASARWKTGSRGELSDADGGELPADWL